MGSGLQDLKYRAVRILRNHEFFVVVCTMLFIALVSIVRINLYNAKPIDDGRIDDETVKLQSVHFDNDAIKKMQQLKESNVQIPSIDLPPDRNNPFDE